MGGNSETDGGQNQRHRPSPVMRKMNEHSELEDLKKSGPVISNGKSGIKFGNVRTNSSGEYQLLLPVRIGIDIYIKAIVELRILRLGDKRCCGIFL